MPIPANPKIYRIVHIDRLPSIVAEGCMLSDSEMIKRSLGGTNIGMDAIKARRLNELRFKCHPDLLVGQCVPFYFCPRSIMLFLIHMKNADLTYKGGQEPIVHLEADLHATIAWAQQNNRRWAFTLSNAGAYYFEDRADIVRLGDINWDAVQARQWAGNGVSRSVKEGKQAEYLIEQTFPWHLVERIGVFSQGYVQSVSNAMQGAAHRPGIEIRKDWYY